MPAKDKSTSKQQTIVAVFPDTKAGKKAYDALIKATEGIKSTNVLKIPFEKLDFGETQILDAFYNADIAVADVTERSYQAVIFYQLGLRESFDMKHNIVTCLDDQNMNQAGIKPAVGTSAQNALPAITVLQTSTSNTFIPFYLDHEQTCWTTEAGSEPMHLEKRFRKAIQEMQSASRRNHKEQFLNHLRKIRESKQGEELKKELQLLQGWIDDDPKLFTADILLNLLLSYRDIQDYASMVALVEKLPDHEQAQKAPVQLQYAFALNRRNQPGDRNKALTILEKVLEHKENHAPDFLCLCGRIYKDKFVESGYKDVESRDKSIEWYRKGFEVQPNEYAGINLATLLVISGKDFATCNELKTIGLTLNMLIGRKGSLESQQDYWIVATFFEISVLAENYRKACSAAECMFKLKPPLWYLKTTVLNIRLINSVRNHDYDTSTEVDKRLFGFWMEFFIESSKEEFTNCQFPVLLLEPSTDLKKQFVYIPSYITFHSQHENTEAKIQIWHCIRDTTVEAGHDWSYNVTAVRSVSINKRDNRGVFLFVVSKFSEDFHIYFSSEAQAKRLHDLVSEALSPEVKSEVLVPDSTEEFEYEYEKTEDDERVVLGKGSFGTVYAAIDVVTKKKMAVKEIQEKDIDQFQSLQEEIQLHKHLQHRNIVQYYGAQSENQVFKIFMELVPGGSLSSLLKYKWGALVDDESTIKYYTRQIVEGMKYLHDQKIVHRDIKGDNVLVNTYSGQIKISDFGTSKRLVGLQMETKSFKGTMQFMAPEVIAAGQRGYGPPADVWSLGCTVIEMATGRPPFFELGSPEAAIFKVGKFKEHPDIPESLSEEAKSFLLRCFDPDPQTRATADELLDHPFLRKPNQSTFPTQQQSEVNADQQMFSTIPLPQASHLKAQYEEYKNKLQAPIVPYDRSISDASSGDGHTRTEDESQGFEQVKMHAQNQTTLIKVLTECKDQFCTELLQKLKEGGGGGGGDTKKIKITEDQLLSFIDGVASYIRHEDEEELRTSLDSLAHSCKDDQPLKTELEQIVYVFPSLITAAHKQYGIAPHRMFAIENEVRRALALTLAILSPVTTQRKGDPANSTDSNSVARKLSRAKATTSTLSATSPGDDKERISLRKQLKDFAEEHTRLMTELVKLREDVNEQLRHSVKEQQLKSQNSKVCKQCGHTLLSAVDVKAHTTIQPAPPADERLLSWLDSLDIDQATVEKFVAEGFSMDDVYHYLTREDLVDMQIRVGLRSRIWGKLLTLRAPKAPV
ncbi:hypothetical protein EMCRGX_G034504 [Ephydatia muelleri]